MAPISVVSPSMECLKEIQEECFKVGIPLKTRHREVAPNQYEVVALFGHVTTHVDQNIILSQIIEEIAVKHDLAALLHEKPFQGVNGSGKHNNWSLRTKDGVNILDHRQVFARTGRVEAYPLVMAAILKAVDQYADLIRLASAAPGNDFRLGACEAPPAIISVYLGEELTAHLQQFRSKLSLFLFRVMFICVIRSVSDLCFCLFTDATNISDVPLFSEHHKTLNLGASVLANIEIPKQDRNRTSPFPYCGDRFEFRALGSSQVWFIVFNSCAITI